MILILSIEINDELNENSASSLLLPENFETEKQYLCNERQYYTAKHNLSSFFIYSFANFKDLRTQCHQKREESQPYPPVLNLCKSVCFFFSILLIKAFLNKNMERMLQESWNRRFRDSKFTKIVSPPRS